MITIVTDSTCDLPMDLMLKYGIQVVPVHIRFGTETYQDRVTIDSAMFYQRVSELGELPQTSQPAPRDFVQVYDTWADQAEAVLSIHVTSKLSGTCHSAEMAAQMVADKIKVQVFDSQAGSAGLGFMCLEAARMAEAGKSIDEILSRLGTVRAQMNIFLTVADLKFAQMSGRVGRLQGALATLLNVKPVIGLDQGALDMIERVRSRKRSLDRLFELVREKVGQTQINAAVIHAQVPDEAQEMLERVQREFNCAETFLHDLALGVAVHLGPGTLGLVAYPVK